MTDKDRAPSTEEKVTDFDQYEGRPELSPPPCRDDEGCDD